MRKMTLGQFADLLEAGPKRISAGTEKALKITAPAMALKAKAKIGRYQHEIGHFPDWEPLKPATIADKRRQGFPAPRPLLRSGKVRASILANVTVSRFTYSIHLGSFDPVARYQELGTSTIPPRPFLAPTLYQFEPIIRQRLSTVLRRSMGRR